MLKRKMGVRSNIEGQPYRRPSVLGGISTGAVKPHHPARGLCHSHPIVPFGSVCFPLSSSIPPKPQGAKLKHFRQHLAGSGGRVQSASGMQPASQLTLPPGAKQRPGTGQGGTGRRSLSRGPPTAAPSSTTPPATGCCWSSAAGPERRCPGPGPSPPAS